MADSFWFPHDVDALGDKHFPSLIKDHGCRGYGAYWMIIEMLHKNNNLLSRDYETLAFEMREKQEFIKEVVEKYSLFRLKGENFASDRVGRNLKNRKEKSKKAKISAEKRNYERNANA